MFRVLGGVCETGLPADDGENEGTKFLIVREIVSSLECCLFTMAVSQERGV